MLEAFCRGTGIPSTCPSSELGGRHRRLIMHGTGEQWFDVQGASGRRRAAEDGEQAAADSRVRCSASNTRAFIRRWKKPAACRRRSGRSWSIWSTKSSARSAAAAGCATTPRPCGSAAGRSTNSAACRWASCCDEFKSWKLTDAERKIAGEVIREIRNRLQFLVDVGLDYLTLARPAPTLSGGEMQRIRLAAQVGSGLCGVLYVLDEPTIGLHPRDNRRLLDALKKLRDLGNTLLVVEHDREVVADADQLLDFGPGAGRNGGQIVARGTPDASRQTPRLGHRPVSLRQEGDSGADESADAAVGKSEVGRQETGRRRKARRQEDEARDGRRHSARQPPIAVPPGGGWLEIVGARHNNLKNINVQIPLGTFTVVTGTSGSGKSSLVEDVLYNSLARTLHRAKTFPGAHDAIRGVEQINKVIRVDQQPLGQTPTSNPATFTGVFDLIRTLYAQLPEAKLRGYTPRRFSFNVPGGRCEKCEGNGQLRIEMHFLPDVWVECDTCRGRRYNPETLAVRYHGRSIADVLDMSCGEAVQAVREHPQDPPHAADAVRRGARLPHARPAGPDALRRRGPAREAGRRAFPARHRPDALPARRADHRPALRRPGQAARRAQSAGRSGQHGRGDRAQSRRDQDGRLGHRPGPRGGRGGRLRRRRRHAGGHRRTCRDRASDESRSRRTRQKAANEGREVGTTSARGSPIAASAGRCFAPTPAKPWPRCWRPGRSSSASCSTSPPNWPNARTTATSPKSAATPACPGKSTAGTGTRVDRVGRTGNPCRWDGRILAEVIDRIQQQSDLFSETDWNIAERGRDSRGRRNRTAGSSTPSPAKSGC